MSNTCPQCQAIAAFELDLDQQAQRLVDRVKDFRRPWVERNNRRWRRFSQYCSWPLVGKLFRLRERPWRIESEFMHNARLPSFYDQSWYKDEVKRIRGEAEKLETLKAADMDHWGDEVVQPCNGHDVGNYYTPLTAPRRDCYAHGYGPFVPDKYSEFGDLAQEEEFSGLVSDTYHQKFTPRPRPRWSLTPTPTYVPTDCRLPDASNGIVPGFNQWLDPHAVQTIGSR